MTPNSDFPIAALAYSSRNIKGQSMALAQAPNDRAAQLMSHLPPSFKSAVTALMIGFSAFAPNSSPDTAMAHRPGVVVNFAPGLSGPAPNA